MPFIGLRRRPRSRRTSIPARANSRAPRTVLTDDVQTLCDTAARNRPDRYRRAVLRRAGTGLRVPVADVALARRLDPGGAGARRGLFDRSSSALSGGRGDDCCGRRDSALGQSAGPNIIDPIPEQILVLDSAGLHRGPSIEAIYPPD